MKKKNKEKISISGNDLFNGLRFLMVAILVLACILSIVDKSYHLIQWPTSYENIVGVSSQIITAVVSLVVSIIGIAISLQNEVFFGIKITKLYALRVTKHYSILEIIIISILLCALNLAFYMCGLTIAAIGTLLVALFS